MTLRKLFFWPHLIAGTIAGLVILIMSVTGVLLMYEKQIMAWADEREYRSELQPSGSGKLPIETLIANVREARGSMPATVTLRSDPSAPALFAYGREGMVYVDPYTGKVLGEGSPKVREFFHVVTDWHRWLALHGERRATGKAITGACNLAFLFLVMSGFYLWWPKRWTWRNLKPVVLFRGGLSGKARDFNWHNVTGLWCAVPLFFIVLGATVISYPWASALVYRVAGSQPPPAQGPPAPGAPKPGEPRRGPGGAGAPARDVPLDGMDRMFQIAANTVPEWRTISLRMPGSAPDPEGRRSAPLTFTVDRGYAGQPQKRVTLTVDRVKEQVIRSESFSSFDAGRRLRTWLRFVHTGEYYGVVGQTIAGVASAGGALLVWTGISLSLRRFRAWRARKRSLVKEKEQVLIERF